MQRRGTELNPQNRFLPIAIELDDECTLDLSEGPRTLKTQWFDDDTQSIVTENDSPDIPFRYSLNPYRGCEHGCAYCYARPYHEYLGWNAGADFESKILVKRQAAELLREWLSRSKWSGAEHLMMSGVTDPYQPIEQKLKVTRGVLEVIVEARQPLSIITKNALILRDLDLLSELAANCAVNVVLSITTLDQSLASALEPRCSIPEARLRAIRTLSESGVPVHVNMAPLIPGLNDHEIPNLLEAAAEAGAQSASWTLLRLPGAVESIFADWLGRHRPDGQEKIMSRLRQLRGGQVNDAQFGRRMHGDGFFSNQWSQLFDVMRRKLGLAERPPPLNPLCFRPPKTRSGQQYLF